jgi:uncharacterized protein YutE (UPF0331/DUF86 family)
MKLEFVLLMEKIDSLGENLADLKEAVKKAKQDQSRNYVHQVQYLLNGVSFRITDVGNELIKLNEGRVFKKTVLEQPMNVRDVFVKLGEVGIISGKIVPYLKKIITMANGNGFSLESVSKTIPYVKEYLFYLKAFLEGTDMTDMKEEDVEVIKKKEEKGEKIVRNREEEGKGKDNKPIAL